MKEITKDILQDLIDHTNGLDGIDLIKITGSEKETLVNAAAENRTLIVNAKFKTPIAGFIGVFGMPNLGKLKTILGFSDEYDENAKITVKSETRPDGYEQPSVIHFENQLQDFVNDYRLMTKTLVEEKIKGVVFKGATWNVDFVPNIGGIQRLKKQRTVHSEEDFFSTTYSDGNIKINFGDPATHSGSFVFQSGVQGSLSRPVLWSVKQFVSIMDFIGDKHIYISEQGVMKITVDSGIADYEFLLPAQSK